ncbi:MAG: ABC transporter ATP-binding protein [Cytophagaceae bacterium]|nr:ABC transporter ATP-binding protein [Cytophagaceae bacterium]|tara:strand:+ start:10197 stop:11468 length:1272 start_codon:yes stop_codon:yes gene_type:complete
MSKVILKAENISKQYRLGLVGTGTLRDDLKRNWARLRGKEDPFLKVGEVNDRSKKGNDDYVWALRDINFEVKQGEVLGIIGKNGAGKSTLLKILSQVTSPTTGRIKSRGRIASLLEVGTGFHPELTGRENIYLNGAILGMNKAEINSKLDEIIDFSGCERYIDTPVKRYSSGMTVRLGFAVAAHLEPEILVVDEVLAVGDAEFQKKAIGKMQDISQGEGRTVLFVSHNMASVQSLCTRGILLENGFIAKESAINKVIDHYLIHQSNKNVLEVGQEYNFPEKSEYLIYVKSITFEERISTGHGLKILLKIQSSSTINVSFALGFRNSFKENVYQILSENTDEYIAISSGTSQIYCETNELPLMPGKFHLTLWVGSGGVTYEKHLNFTSIEVQEGFFREGIRIKDKKYPVVTDANWRVIDYYKKG